MLPLAGWGELTVKGMGHGPRGQERDWAAKGEGKRRQRLREGCSMDAATNRLQVDTGGHGARCMIRACKRDRDKSSEGQKQGQRNRKARNRDLKARGGRAGRSRGDPTG